MPPALTASPHLVTPSRAYCTAPTSSSPPPSPSRARMWPRRKNSHQNGLCSKFSYLTGCWRFGLGGKTGCSETPEDPDAAAHGMGRLAAYDVLQTGSGTAHSRAVTRCKRALTGQELGRWRRILSLYCLICVAILKSVRMIVEGCAWAKAVCCRVCVRKA